jgi:multidrug efflux pump subunit AcrB
MPVGSSLEYANERVKRVEEALREFKEIDAVDTGIGTAGEEHARINLKLFQDRRRTQKQMEQAIRSAWPRRRRRPAVGWGGRSMSRCSATTMPNDARDEQFRKVMQIAASPTSNCR